MKGTKVIEQRNSALTKHAILAESEVPSSKKDKKQKVKEQDENKGLQMNLNSEIISHEGDKFAKIMAMDGIKPQDVMKSLHLELNRDTCFKAGEGVG